MHLGEYYQRIDQPENAIEEYSTAITLDPNNYEAYSKRATLKLALGSYQDAREDAQKAIYNNRRFFPAFVIRGIASFNLGNYGNFEYDFNIYLREAKKAQDYFFSGR